MSNGKNGEVIYFDNRCSSDLERTNAAELTANPKTCPVCNKVFPPNTNLSFHLMLHPCSEQPYSCDHCIYVTMIKEELFQHCKQEHPYTGNLTCLVCNKQFTNIRSLNKHKPIHAIVLPYKCLYCDKGYAEFVVWRQHEVSHKTARFQCPNCKVRFTTFSIYSNHCNTGACKTEVLKCCEEVFSTRLKYVEHGLNYHRQKKNLVELGCEFCGRLFAFKHKLSKHLTQCRERNKESGGTIPTIVPESPAYIPFQVDYSLSNSSLPNPVTAELTEDGLKYKCDICEKYFKSKAWLMVHHKKHIDPTSKNFTCRICGRSYSSSSALYYHNRRDHMKLQPYKCSYCGKTFACNSSWRDHQPVHTGEQPYGCTLCPKRYNNRSSRNEHLRSHTGERPYKCKYCELDFARLHAKVQHERRHTGEKPFKCTVCDRRFTQHSTWRSHEKRHLPPHTCTVCDQVFTSKDTFTAHKKTHYETVAEEMVYNNILPAHQAVGMSTDSEGNIYIYQEAAA